MFDWRIEPDAQKIILAGELLAIDNRALHPESRRRRNKDQLAWSPELLCEHSDAESADILRGSDFKNSWLMEAGQPQGGA
jgi:hypothetical protein